MTTPPRAPRRGLSIEPATRIPRLHSGTWIAIALYAAILLGWEAWLLFAEPPADGEVRTLCGLRAATGVPCPGCGSTRSVKAALGLDPVAAFVHNPMVFLGGSLLVLALLLRLATGRTLRLHCSTRGWTVVAMVVGGLVLANWAWVLDQHGFLG